ncbi:P-loop containing nucleoside triphosphate hydrolase protein [Auriculariales sp. MPI-PUGE-AT-0066]|nr:P-loop containing nucleoside triphosphate hydrolase protein [Auriculariales sp. MPI-PUGE-AT-0066]
MRALELAHNMTAYNDIADVKKELQVLNQSATTNITINLDVCSVPPPKPDVFHGRDDSVKSLVEKVIEHSTQQAAANLGILGNGGLGKTSLAQTVMWERPIVERFGPRRFFLSCEPLVDATGVGAALGKLFDVPASKDILQGIITHLESHSRTLLVLDNLETVWLVPDDRARSQLELLLRRLAAIPTLTLIITSRGIVLPRGIRWANVASATLEPFSAEAALQTFDDIAGSSENDDKTERAAVVELMKDVDYMPLAVTLLAQLAQCGEKPSALLRHWKKSHTAMLKTDPLASGRETNVAASIAVSIKLLTAGSNDKEPLQLLSICAHLPAGLRTSVFGQLEPHFEDLDSARRSLKALSLISVGAQDELRMLSPIRHFVLSAHQMTADHLAAMRRIYFDIAASAPRGPSEEFTTKSTDVAAEYENLNVFLLHLINTEEPSQSLVDAVTAISHYAYWIAPSVTLLVALRNRLDGHALWLAECCQNIGRIYIHLNEYASASDALLQASEIFNRIGDRWWVAYCTLLLGECQRAQGFYEVAVQRYTAARDTFLELQDHLNASLCLMRLGDVAFYQEKYEDAKQYITLGRSAFTGESEHRLYAAHCTLSLGEIYTEEGNFAVAETELQTAQSEYQALGDQFGIGQCMRLLGDLRRRQRDFLSAEELLVSAREQFIRMGRPLDQANGIYYIGLLRRDQGRTQEALEAFRTAAQICERIEASGTLENCRLEIAGLGNVEM